MKTRLLETLGKILDENGENSLNLSLEETVSRLSPRTFKKQEREWLEGLEEKLEAELEKADWAHDYERRRELVDEAVEQIKEKIKIYEDVLFKTNFPETSEVGKKMAGPLRTVIQELEEARRRWAPFREVGGREENAGRPTTTEDARELMKNSQKTPDPKKGQGRRGI